MTHAHAVLRIIKCDGQPKTGVSCTHAASELDLPEELLLALDSRYELKHIAHYPSSQILFLSKIDIHPAYDGIPDRAHGGLSFPPLKRPNQENISS